MAVSRRRRLGHLLERPPKEWVGGDAGHGRTRQRGRDGGKGEAVGVRRCSPRRATVEAVARRRQRTVTRLCEGADVEAIEGSIEDLQLVLCAVLAMGRQHRFRHAGSETVATSDDQVQWPVRGGGGGARSGPGRVQVRGGGGGEG